MEALNSSQWTTRVSNIITVAGQNQLLTGNPQRKAVSFMHASAFASCINVHGCINANNGWIDDVNHPERTFLFRDWGPMVGFDWYSFDTAGGQAWVIVELLFLG